MYKRIKKIRIALNLSQKAFGKKIGVSRDVIGNIEYNRVKPKELLLNHICTIYNVNRHWLETGEGQMFLDIKTPENLAKAIEVLEALSPVFQEYALSQLLSLLELQKNSMGFHQTL